MKKLFYPLNLSSVLGWILIIQDIYMLFAQDNCYDSYPLMFREFQLDTDRWQPAVHVLVIQLKALQFLMHWNLFSCCKYILETLCQMPIGIQIVQIKK